MFYLDKTEAYLGILGYIGKFFSRGKTQVSILKVPLDADALLTSLFCSSTAPWTLGDVGKSCMNASPPTGFTGKPHAQTHLPLG